MLRRAKLLFLIAVLFTVGGRESFSAVPPELSYLTETEWAIGKAVANSYEYAKKREGWEKAWGPAYKFIWEGTRLKDIIYLPEGKSASELPPDKGWEIRQKECANYLKIAKQEMFPYYEKMAAIQGEYAGYFLLWEAYFYSSSDAKKAKTLTEETAKRYPDASIGKVAKKILDKAKDEKTLASLIQQEFPKIPNPVESYKPKKGEPPNSLMNNLKSAIASTTEYKKWKKVFILGDYSNLSKGKAQSFARQAIEEIINILDEQAASSYLGIASPCLTAPDKDLNLYKHYLNLIITRYPHTSCADSAKRRLELFGNPEKTEGK